MRRIIALLIAVSIPAAAFAGGTTAPGIVQSGPAAAGHCAQFAANGVAIDSGASCGTGTAGVIQSQGTSSQVLVNGDALAHTGATTYSLPNSVIIGTTSTATGQLGLKGTTSGTVTIQPQSAAGTYNFNLPTTAGTANQPLLSGGGGASPMTYGSLSGNTTTFGTTSGSLTSGDCAKFDASGNVVDAGAPCGSGSGGVSSVGLSVPATSILGVTGSPVTTSGTLGLTTTGTSGGIPYFSSTSQLATSAALTANAPVIGGGAGVAPSVGTRSGNTTAFVTTTGSHTTSDCAQWDASGNLIDAGAACGSGGGSLTVTDGTHSVTSTTTLTVGNNFVVSGSAGSATVNSTFTDATKTTSYTAAAGDMGNGLTLAATTGTPALTLPAASSTIFAPGMTLTVSVPKITSGVNWTLTNSTGLTLRGLNSTTLLPGTQGTFSANSDGVTLDFFPGAQVATTTALGSVMPDGTTITITNGVISSTGGGSGCTVSGTQFQLLAVNGAGTGCTNDPNATVNSGTLTLGNSGIQGSVVLNGSTSGTGTIVTPAAAGTATYTLPAATDTIVGRATTDTLSNKTLVAPALGTPVSGVLTNATGLPAASVVAGALASGMTATTQSAKDNSTKLATTAYVDRPTQLTTGSGAQTVTGPRQYLICTATCTVTVPVPAAGDEFCVINDVGASGVITISNPGSSTQFGKTDQSAYGTATTGTMVSGGAVGDKVCIGGKDSTHYNVLSFNGTWTNS